MLSFEIDIDVQDKRWRTLKEPLEGLIEHVCSVCIEALSLPQAVKTIELSVLLTDDRTIQTYNDHYRHKNKPTNVLSFPVLELKAGSYQSLTDHVVLGDLVLAFDTIENEAKEQNKELIHHVIHLMVHGILHLFGYDHEQGEEDALIMERLEVNILRKMDIPNPYDPF